MNDVAKEIKSELHRRVVENLRARRKSLKMTQQQMADKLGMSRPSYTQIESGEWSPGLELLERLAEALGTEPSTLLEDMHVHVGSV